MSYLQKLNRKRPTGIPIILFHLGNPGYLHATVSRLRRVSNNLILIGDATNRGADVNVHINYKTLRSPELNEFEQHFVNYSTNPAEIEKICFARVFYICEWMKRSGFANCVYLDTDCILLRPPEEIFGSGLAYIYNEYASDDPAKMAATIHASFLTYEFCVAFQSLCRDIYVTKSRFSLIEPKIRYHKETGAPGGICDMTLYYLLTKEMTVAKLLDVQSDGSTFDDNINDTLGFLGKNTFVLENGKKVLRKNGTVVEALCSDGRWVRLNNLHFQGGAKQYINAIFP